MQYGRRCFLMLLPDRLGNASIEPRGEAVLAMEWQESTMLWRGLCWQWNRRRALCYGGGSAAGPSCPAFCQ